MDATPFEHVQVFSVHMACCTTPASLQVVLRVSVECESQTGEQTSPPNMGSVQLPALAPPADGDGNSENPLHTALFEAESNITEVGDVPAETVVPENSEADDSTLETVVMLESVEVATDVSTESPTAIVYVRSIELPLDSNLLFEDVNDDEEDDMVKSTHDKLISLGEQFLSLAMPQ